jgi:hypothetical protein
MSETEGALVMVLLFALRCIVPLAITIGLGYLMNRLVDHWEAEDARKKAPAPAPAPRPAAQSILSIPCWVTNSCPEKVREKCVAYRNPGLPCWEARRQPNGALQTRCAGCPRYQAAFAVAMAD